MNEPDGISTRSLGIGDDDLPGPLWTEGGLVATDDQSSADPRSRLVSLGFIKAALKRRARLWLALAVVGLIAGAGFYIAKPPAYQAQTTILVDDGANADGSAQILTDAALAQTTAVGTAVIAQLGLTENVPTFLGSYVVTTSGFQVLIVTLSAPTSGAAVQRAAAVATQFLALRAQFENVQQQQLEQSLNNQLALAQGNLQSITNRVNQLSQQPSTAQQKTQLAALRAQEQVANNAYGQIQQTVTDSKLNGRVATQQANRDSRVINAATPVRHSRVLTLLLYVGGGLMGGLVIGFAIIAIGALTSDRLRRRDDIAYAIGSPVRLSVGPLRAGRIPYLSGGPKHRDRDMRSVVEYLRRITLPQGQRGAGGLAIVAVDDAGTVAKAVVSLAFSRAKEGKRVLLADLSEGRHAARILGAAEPGVRHVSSQGTNLVMAVPADGELTPTGPFRSRSSITAEQNSPADKALVDAGSSADLVLSLVTLDPRGVSDHLRTWASDAVAVVTAGESTAERVHSIGEMIRLGGAHLDSTVLLGADPHDQSLGVIASVY